MNGVRNFLLLFFSFYFMQFLIKEYDGSNVKYLYIILPSSNDLFCGGIILIIIFIRYIIVFFYQSFIILFIMEIFTGYLIYNNGNFIISFLSGVFSIISTLKIYSFLVTIRQLKMKNKKDKNDGVYNYSGGLTNEDVIGIRSKDPYKYSKISLYSESSVKDYDDGNNLIEENIYDKKYYLRFIFTPTLIYSDNLLCEFSLRKTLLHFFGVVSTAILTLLFNIYYFIPQIIRIGSVFNCYSSIDNLFTMFFIGFIEWILIFLGFFHFYLNFMSALTLYPYESECWWNVKKVSLYWRYWNSPTHYWMKEYVYIKPKSNVEKIFSIFHVFFVSGILHEYLFFLSFKKIRFIGLMSMLSHPIIMKVGDMFYGCGLGNLFFWISFSLVGFPVCMLKTYEYLNK
ncbi:putative membrane bound O-acyl transferase [Spraguea lophii 42_110]|uniref:Putative membrane bound O-acyl transferase n=1 Tax=Spraguea lophii (strain 42_110) TaxID=1358809 RepID=S7XUW8_SPRLO|nr:putative membrane bound O-acyl transferase [Spraguea lophii 42_110]